MRNKIILLMLLSIITAFSYQESYEVLAHFEEIDVTFDACVPLDYEHGNDGINEKWYNIPQYKIERVYQMLRVYDKKSLKAYMFNYHIKNKFL